MSVWTHVNASFRLDSFGSIDDSEIIKTFGKAVDYEHFDEIEYDENLEVKDKDQYLPMGSEGTLCMNIWHNPDKHCIASTIVNVFGDLRDFDSIEEIKNWFNKCCSRFWVRQAVCQVDCPPEQKVFTYKEDEDDDD